MAICTAGGDPRVIVTTACEGPSRPNSVTTVAGQTGLDMSGRLPRCLDSIMTGGTGAGSDSGMGKGYCRPHRRTMAGVARLRSWNMGRRFSPLDGIVMAGGARSWSDPVVGEKSRHPVGRAVATVTIHCGRKMVCRLERRHDPPSGRVTLETLRRGSTKYPLSMAPFTYHLGMAARQLESG